jgi:DNA helicase HerA-like ATPase
MSTVGYVVGEANTQEFTFVTDTEKAPARLEYLVLEGVQETTENGTREVNILAQVTNLTTTSEVLGEDLSLDELESIQARYQSAPRIYGTAKILGYLTEKAGRKTVVNPRSAALPGHEVHIAGDDFLKEFFTKDIDLGLEIGSLITRSSVPVNLDPNGLRRHLAIIAQTGAGKSYLSGLVIEQLLQLGGTVLIFDPNSDYVRMRYERREDESEAPTETDFADDIEIYRPPGVAGRRFDDDEIGGSEEFTARFSELSNQDVFNFARVPSNATRIQQAIRTAREHLDEEGDYGPEELLEELETIASTEGHDAQGGAARAREYVRGLTGLDIWGYNDLPIENILEPMQASVVDLAGMPSYVSEFVVDKTLSDIWRKASTGDLSHPVFIVLEEAHNFVPDEGSAYSAATINTVASEGRKFGMFLTTITQRPGKIDEETLSQCNSQIVMRLTNPVDQNAVRKASESMTEDLLDDLPGLNVGEAIVTGELTRVPAMVDISGRTSAEGGSDIDLTAALEEARTQATTQSDDDFGFPSDASTEAEH